MSPGPAGAGRPKSVVFPSSSTSPATTTSPKMSHTRSQSQAVFGNALVPTSQSSHGMARHTREGTPGSNTFAPSFIKTEEMRRSADAVKGIEGENDFSGKRYVWLQDPQTAFVKGWIVQDLGGNRILVQCEDGSVSWPSSPALPQAWSCIANSGVTATRGRRGQRRQGQSGQVRQGQRHG